MRKTESSFYMSMCLCTKRRVCVRGLFICAFVFGVKRDDPTWWATKGLIIVHQLNHTHSHTRGCVVAFMPMRRGALLQFSMHNCVQLCFMWFCFHQQFLITQSEKTLKIQSPGIYTHTTFSMLSDQIFIHRWQYHFSKQYIHFFYSEVHVCKML